MALIFVQARISDEVIRKDTEEGIPKMEEWFKQNPKRKICNARGWYDALGIIQVRRGHVKEDMEKARDKAIKFNHER